MKNLFFNQINQAGLVNLSSPLEYRRVLFVNNLALASFVVSLAVTILIFFEGLFPQYLITGIGGMLFLVVLYLNYSRLYYPARIYFLLLSTILLVTASFIAFRQGRFNDSENILIGFMAVSYFLFDGKSRYIGYIGIFLILIWLKFHKQEYIQEPYDLNFFITIQNTGILSIVLFLFVDTFRASLMKAFVRLKDKDELLYSMIDNVPLFIGLIDTERRYKMVNINYENAFGKKRDQIIGSHVSDVLPSNILDTHLPLINKSLAGESPEFLELTKMPDGQSFYAAGKYIPVRSKDGKVIGVAVFVNDVTKLESAKKDLEEANKTKDRLFSIVAHDIRGPLDLFEGLLNVSFDGHISKEDFLKHQENISEKLTGLRETVSTLLEWARSQLSGINTQPISVKASDVIQTNVDLYRELIKRKSIRLTIDVSNGLEVWIDENHFKIAIRNMIHNALKFTPKKGKVSITAKEESEKVFISIHDTGIGMDLTRINSIMKKELQDSKSGTGGELGTGLGLSLSLGLLEKNNCSVTINSEPEAGTKIEIAIPSGINK